MGYFSINPYTRSAESQVVYTQKYPQQYARMPVLPSMVYISLKEDRMAIT